MSLKSKYIHNRIFFCILEIIIKNIEIGDLDEKYMENFGDCSHNYMYNNY